MPQHFIDRFRTVAWAAVATCSLVGNAACDARDPPPRSPQGDRLQALPIGADTVTTSGISAGGYMAGQFHVAQSTLVHGAGLLASGPYDCAANSMANALGRCTKRGDEIPTAELVTRTRELARRDEIDPIENLTDDRVWIYRGGADPVVAKPVVDALETYYQALVTPSNVARVELPGAGHTFPALDASLGACGTTESPFVANCERDGARELLEHLYGSFTRMDAAPGDLRTFRQAPYARAADADGFAAKGWLYVPNACRHAATPSRCRLHVVFHGCRQGSSFIQDTFVRRSGYLAAADAGDVVVLFPQLEPSLQPLNPMGCWDWWGYSGEAYATRRGPQVMAVRAMVDDLLGISGPTDR